MTDERFEEIDRLVEDAGRCFDPVTGRFEPLDGEGDEDDDATDMDFDPGAFLAALGVTDAECGTYVDRKIRDYEEAFRDA